MTKNANGTTALTWSIGTLAGTSGAQTVEYTARPGLLFVGGDSVQNSVQVTFTNANGCTYTPVTASGTTGITEVTPSADPEGEGFWKTHPERQTGEILAMIQATDQRFDGTDGSTPDGQLSVTETVLVLSGGGTQADQLKAQLLATYFNLADRRINASTAIASKLTVRLGLDNVREAALYGQGTLGLPLNRTNAGRYSNAIGVLDQINRNRSEVY